MRGVTRRDRVSMAEWRLASEPSKSAGGSFEIGEQIPGSPMSPSGSDNSSVTTTVVARVELPCGGFDALSADHFAMRYPPHFHDTWAIGVIEAGLLRLRTARGEWIGSPGTILAFAPGEIHSAEAMSPNGYQYRMIYPENGLIQAIGTERAEAANRQFSVPVFMDHELAWRLVRAHQPLMDGDWGVPSESRLVHALRALWHRQGGKDQRSAHHPGDVEKIARARDFLSTCYMKPVRLTSIARECGVGSFQLIRIFQRVLGVSPYAYLVQMRVNRARELLHQGVGVSEVAYLCGFSDQSHLTRVFRKAIGVPPGVYRKSVRVA